MDDLPPPPPPHCQVEAQWVSVVQCRYIQIYILPFIPLLPTLLCPDDSSALTAVVVDLEWSIRPTSLKFWKLFLLIWGWVKAHRVCVVSPLCFSLGWDEFHIAWLLKGHSPVIIIHLIMHYYNSTLNLHLELVVCFSQLCHVPYLFIFFKTAELCLENEFSKWVRSGPRYWHSYFCFVCKICYLQLIEWLTFISEA